MIGRNISHYRILEKLGGGGMGVVYRAVDVKLDRPVALKFLPSRWSDDEMANSSFIREARAASALDHPNICTIYEIDETEEGQLFIAMACYEGSTLEERLRDGPLSVAQVVDYGHQIAAGLSQTHARNIIHRDIKPANLLITAEGLVKILDFGLARILEPEGSSAGTWITGLVQGTPTYMAPEQIRGNAVDARIDLWSLGVVLYEALAGAPPFTGADVTAIVDAIFNRRPTPLTEKRIDVPATLVAIIERLLAKNPHDRYPSFATLLEDLEMLGGGASEDSTTIIKPSGPAPRSTPADESFTDAQNGTSSLEASRFFVEGTRLHMQFKEEEALELFLKAVEFDPGFALAWARLAVVHRNLGHPDEAVRCARCALEHDERLTPRDRAYIQGFYYSHEPLTWSRAIVALERALELDEQHHMARQSLTVLCAALERYDEAARHGEELIRRGSRFQGAYATLAEIYAARGEHERADALLADFASRHPDDFMAHCARGWLYRRWGRYRAAVSAFERAERLRPGVAVSFIGLGGVHLLRGDWEAGAALSRRQAALREPAQRGWAAELQLLRALFRGSAAEARAVAERAVEELSSERPRSVFRVWAARIDLERGEFGAALRGAQLARHEARGDLRECQALFEAARAELGRGRPSAARRLAERLAIFAAEIPGALEKRRHHHLLGLVSSFEGDTENAVAELEKAVELLPVRGVWTPNHEPDHVPLWFSLAEAHRAAGDESRAEAALRRIVDSTEERLAFPTLYVKSLYLLGELLVERDAQQEARRFYERFLEHWEGGDLKSGWIAAARRYVVRQALREERAALSCRTATEPSAKKV